MTSNKQNEHDTASLLQNVCTRIMVYGTASLDTGVFTRSLCYFLMHMWHVVLCKTIAISRINKI